MKATLINIQDSKFIIQFDRYLPGMNLLGRSGKAIAAVGIDNEKQIYLSTDLQPCENINEAWIWFKWTYAWNNEWQGFISFNNQSFNDAQVEMITALWDQITEMVMAEIIKANPDFSFKTESPIL